MPSFTRKRKGAASRLKPADAAAAAPKKKTTTAPHTESNPTDDDAVDNESDPHIANVRNKKKNNNKASSTRSAADADASESSESEFSAGSGCDGFSDEGEREIIRSNRAGRCAAAGAARPPAAVGKK